jgi:hypothetical protein
MAANQPWPTPPPRGTGLAASTHGEGTPVKLALQAPTSNNEPFFQVAPPIIITFAIATLFQSKRMDDLSKRIVDVRDSMNQRFDAVERRLERIENLLTDHDRRITVLEERTSPLHR